MPSPLLRIGTRGSPMALAQARQVGEALAAAHPALAAPGAIELVVVRTTGDKIQDRPLAEMGGKGLFIKEIEEALLDRRIDLAVHSAKDVPSFLPDGLELACFLERDDPRDAFVSLKADDFGSLAPASVIGTSSPRRQAQILARWPGLKVVPFRGNAETRLRKLAEGQADVTLLAIAGLVRIGRREAARKILSPEEMLPAVGQGAIAVEIRAQDGKARDWLAPLAHAPTAAVITAERAMLAVLEGSCRTPIAGFAEIDAAGILTLKALVAMPDGSAVHRTMQAGGSGDAVRIGREAGRALKTSGGAAFFSALA
ncbi:MAG TPA: hydroxymethylbilane synthase [Alphaproteobacteria bacterium]|nr:hydroxymethylbilane synthase [Alphaproteobacteria bacterium]